MRKSHLGAVLAGSLLSIGLISVYSAAQVPGQTAIRPRAPAGSTIALLDVPFIFKNHARFKAMMGDMKADAQRTDAELKADREAVQKLIERLKDFRKGTPDYKALAEEITKRQADISVKIRLRKEEFLAREARIYYTIYQEILQEVDYFAGANGISMVLRFNGEVANVDQPETVLRDINKQVIWYTKDRDITQAILYRLNQRAMQHPGPMPAGGANPGPVGTRPAHGVNFPPR